MKKTSRKTWLVAIISLFMIASVIPSIGAVDEAVDDLVKEQQNTRDIFWEDNFDSYEDGSELHGQGGWKGWDNVPDGSLVSSVQSRSSPHSADIFAASDLVHEYEGCTSGQWTYTAWQYIPVDIVGQSYFILLSDYTDGAGQANSWAVQLRFDSDVGVVESEHGGPNLPLITGEWVEIRVEIDLDVDWMQIYYDSELLEEKAWTATPNNDGSGFLNIAAVDLFANSATSVYYDDLVLEGGATGPDLTCDGELAWADVTTGSTVTGEITVSNIGAAASELDWEVDSYPSWGTWTFDPESGTDLTPEDGEITIAVEVVAPEDKNTEFSGVVKLINSENENDFCEIDVSLATPMSHEFPFLERFIANHPILGALLEKILG